MKSGAHGSHSKTRKLKYLSELTACVFVRQVSLGQVALWGYAGLDIVDYRPTEIE